MDKIHVMPYSLDQYLSLVAVKSVWNGVLFGFYTLINCGSDCPFITGYVLKYPASFELAFQRNKYFKLCLHVNSAILL